jgi:hypothetical protein
LLTGGRFSEVVIITGLIVFCIFQAYSDWQENPVLTTVKSTSYPVDKIEFPALTICGQGSNEVILNAGNWITVEAA